MLPRLARRVSVAFAALVVCALCALSVAHADDKTIDDFRRFFRRLEARHDRVEAVLALEGIDDPRVVGLLVPVLSDADAQVSSAALRVLGKLAAPASRAAISDAFVKSKQPRERSALLDVMAEFGAPFDEPLAKAVTAALADKQWTVRLSAAKAFAACGGEAGEARLVACAKDPEPAVRAGVLDALAAKRSRAVVDPALALLVDPVWQVRAAAISALGTVRDVRAIPALIARFDAEEGRLVVDVAEALVRLTGRDFGRDAEGWKRFWKNFGDRYVMPTDEELAKALAAREATRQEYAPVGETTYHGIETPSRAMVFVIDVSGSMEAHVVEKERFEGGGYPSYSRMDIVKTELARTIERLEPHVRFNIFAFATEVMPWRKELVPASGLYKKSAVDWAMKLEPIGRAEDMVMAQAGLVAASNMHLGKTNTYGALMAALGVGQGKGGGVTSGYQVDVDTIFFLSDGQPTTGDFVEPNEILAAVREANALRRVVIHTLAIGDFDLNLMRQLAREHGGTFVNLGK